MLVEGTRKARENFLRPRDSRESRPHRSRFSACHESVRVTFAPSHCKDCVTVLKIFRKTPTYTVNANSIRKIWKEQQTKLTCLIFTYSFGGPGKNRSKYIPNFFKVSSFIAMSVGENVVNPVPLITSPESFFQKYNWKKTFQKVTLWVRVRCMKTQGKFPN